LSETARFQSAAMIRKFIQPMNVCLVKIDHFRKMAHGRRFHIDYEIELLLTRKRSLRAGAVPVSPKRTCFGQSLSWTQIGFGPFVATSTSKKVAVLRTVPAIVMSGSDNGGCFSANASRRLLTFWR
jgi:hypothetical protein